MFFFEKVLDVRNCYQLFYINYIDYVLTFKKLGSMPFKEKLRQQVALFHKSNAYHQL